MRTLSSLTKQSGNNPVAKDPDYRMTALLALNKSTSCKALFEENAQTLI